VKLENIYWLLAWETASVVAITHILKKAALQYLVARATLAILAIIPTSVCRATVANTKLAWD